MMEFRNGQFLVILSPFTDSEAYGYINSITEDSLILSVNPAGFLRNGWGILCILKKE